MTSDEFSQDEIARLQALHALQVLDTAPESRFNRIVEYAAREFDVPIALISLVDKDRQWFKAKVGVDICGSKRSDSICSHAIESPGILLIEDLTQDPRFADNIFVTQPPFIRSYTGVPLILSTGQAVGSLCVIDIRPRRFQKSQLLMLGALGGITVQELERNQAA